MGNKNITWNTKSRSNYEACHSAGLSNIFDHLGFCDVHLNSTTHFFFHFTTTEMQPPLLGLNPQARAQQCNIITTALLSVYTNL